jgi:putative addiction module component (TIGR02574 family)
LGGVFALGSEFAEQSLFSCSDLWGSLKPEDFVLIGEQQAELDRRLNRADHDGPVGTSWETVRAKMIPNRS